MNNPEKVNEYIIGSKLDVAAALNKIRRVLEKNAGNGPLVIHLSRQLLDGAIPCDHHDRAKIKVILDKQHGS